MKKENIKKRIAVLGLCTVLGIASVGAIASFADQTTATTSSEAAQPMNNGRYMGKITAIESGSITIETMGGRGHGGRGMGKMGETLSADGTLPTNASGELETPPAAPTNASGETETPPALPTNASGESETLSADAQGAGKMGETKTMTFTADSSLTSGFSVGDMVEITAEDGTTATVVTAAQKPADMTASEATA